MNPALTSRSGLPLRLVPLAALALLCVPSVAYTQAPGEVTDLAWCAGTETCLQWTPTANASRYQVVRGVRGGLPSLLDGGIDSCGRTLVQQAAASGLTENPPSKAFFWSLVTAANACGEGPAGNATAGARIVNASGNCDPTCSDLTVDGDETDVDCGGPTCAPCADLESCLLPGDCASHVCQAGACQPSTCVDGVQNGNEAGVDCGGGSCPTCGIGQTCCADADCQSSVCTSGHCAAPSCADGVQNGNETGVDCGWASCGFCPDAQGCLANSDCGSGICEGGSCQSATCTVGLTAGKNLESPLAECGSSGNTNWSYTAAIASTMSVLNDTSSDLYLASGTTLTRLDPGTEVPLNTRDFSTVTLRRPIVPRLQGGATNAVFVGGSDGYAYGLNPDTLANVWSRSLRRSTCTSDSIAAAAAFQRRDISDANFQAARTQDLVIFGTSYACGTTTGNKVYALDASNGNLVWIFNATGTSYAMDRVTGLAVDYGRNLVYVVSHKSDPGVTQSTVWALKTTTGSRLWSADLGSIDVEPAFAHGGLYVATGAGSLAKLDPATGAATWSTLVTPGGVAVKSLSVQDSSPSIHVVDTAGTIHALIDTCASAGYMWSTNLSGALAGTAPAVLAVSGKLYVGAEDGRVYQLDTTTGENESYATIGGAGTSSSDPLLFIAGPLRLIASAGGIVKQLCIPWAADHGDKAFLVGEGQAAGWRQAGSLPEAVADRPDGIGVLNGGEPPQPAAARVALERR